MTARRYQHSRILQVISKMGTVTIPLAQHQQGSEPAGSDRRAMGYLATVGSFFGPAPRWQRPAMPRRSGDPQWHSLDLAYGGPPARSARPVSPVPEVASPLPTLGALRCHGHAPASASRRPTPAWRARPDRVLHRRPFCHRKKGAQGGTTKRGNGTKVLAVADRTGLPVAVSVASAAPPEGPLVEPPRPARVVTPCPERLLGARADAREPLETRLPAQGTEVIAPHRANRQPPTQDGRARRR